MRVFYGGARRLAPRPLHILISSVAGADEGTAFLRQSTNPSAASHVWADNLGEFLGLLPGEILIADSAGEALCGLYSGGVACGDGRGEQSRDEDDGDEHTDLVPRQSGGELAGHAADLGLDAG